MIPKDEGVGRPSPMLVEIREQAELIGRLLPRLRGAAERLVRPDSSQRLHLVGCGDMFFAASLVRELARRLWGSELSAWRPMDVRWLAPHLSDRDLVVCASISGRTRRTLEAAQLAVKAGARVLALTDDPGSPLHRQVGKGLVLGTAEPELLHRDAYAGYKNAIAQTQTFSVAFLAELMLVACALGRQLETDGLQGWMQECTRSLDSGIASAVGDFFAGAERVVVLGSGPHLPVARYGAAKFLEFAVPALAQCLEEYNHLEVFLADASTRVVLLAADEPSRHRARELTAAWEVLGSRSLVLAAPGGRKFPGKRTLCLPLTEGDPLQTALAEIVGLQLLAVHAAPVMGRDPCLWLGGRRAELIQRMSQQTIRESRLWE